MEFVAGDYRPEEFFRWRRDMRKTKEGANAVPYALEWLYEAAKLARGCGSTTTISR